MATNPLLMYGLLAMGLMASLTLFLSLKREIHRQSARTKVPIVEKPSERPAPEAVFVPAQPRSGINMNRRVHALRLLRHGESVAHVAAALGVPRREIELLVRVSGEL